jgi:hypothetical protein
VVLIFEQGEVCTLNSEDSGLVGQIIPDVSEDRSTLEMLGAICLLNDTASHYRSVESLATPL